MVVELTRRLDDALRAGNRRALQRSDALGAAATQIGPGARAAAVALHSQMGLLHGKVTPVSRLLLGIAPTRGASAQISLRAATRLVPNYQLILGGVRGSEQLAADEEGWRIGERPAWLHAFELRRTRLRNSRLGSRRAPSDERVG
ncbi:hypothetical protein [Paludisphaera rhizosphaerae]|uniref:hypothetical protein n=1 Tax=Paludisphaera rhizosphaerae TaxID=2711216 RepID=UPI0013EC6C24|nr:hypothetical protein [Paludisphaera rhizosphaerae]